MIVYISKRPKNIQIIINKRAKGVSTAKELRGPTNFKPGPTFPRAEATAENELIKSKPLEVRKKITITKIVIYKKKKLSILVMTLCDTI